MRRFSQRNSLVTLSDINITPLLDLAFVLLIIFMITTPLLEQGMQLNLPHGGKPDNTRLDPRNIRTIDISQNGLYRFRGAFSQPEAIAGALRREQAGNPNLIVYIRGDQEGALRYTAAMLNQLERVGVVNISLRTDPTTRR
jgi:biopolymer transport protein ExbD